MQDWDTLERLFSEALELPCEQRPQFVRERSGENLWLRHELETLLEAPETSIEAAFDPSSGIVRQLLAALDTEYAVGREIGGYRIESLISSGGMGIVYRSSHIGTGEPAALKLLPPEDARNSDRMRRLAREAAALQMLYHPGIVRIREFRADAGAHFLAMELVEGETLRAVLGRGPIGLRQALDWARQIAAAVEAAHAAGVIHRDLKPSNVMIESPDSRVKLLDFGLARVPDAQSPHTQTTTGGAVAGTFAYFSPEQAKGGRGDERSDIFSFGAILYEMIAGRPAFDRPTGVATAAAVLSESPAPLPVQTPRAVRALLARCLAKDPARRFAGMGEIGEELERLLALEQRGRLRPGPRRPFLWAAACMLVVICASAALWWARHKAAAAPPSVAVLPFTNANGDPANQYLVDGLTEELTAGLSTAKGITVAVPSAAAPYNKGPRNLPDIGRRLHVSYLVEASMERTGDHLTVVASLERASGERVWTNTYQRRSVDLNAIESDLAEGIRGSLGLAKPISGPFTPSDKAHDLYLKARFEDDGVTLASNDKARADYRQVLELEPRYAAAYAGLAATFWNRNILAGQNASREDLRQAEAYWRKALELDPGYAAGAQRARAVCHAIRLGLESCGTRVEGGYCPRAQHVGRKYVRMALPDSGKARRSRSALAPRPRSGSTELGDDW